MLKCCDSAAREPTCDCDDRAVVWSRGWAVVVLKLRRGLVHSCMCWPMMKANHGHASCILPRGPGLLAARVATEAAASAPPAEAGGANHREVFFVHDQASPRIAASPGTSSGCVRPAGPSSRARDLPVSGSALCPDGYSTWHVLKQNGISQVIRQKGRLEVLLVCAEFS